MSAKQICFVYANNLWVAPREGGVASPVANPPGAESLPRFSPDGSSIAFVGNYDGIRDIYTIAVTGGVPVRVTNHPGAEQICDWSPDGSSIIMLTNSFSGLARQTKIFTVPVSGGIPAPLPVPYAGFGSISPDGKWLAYTPHSTDTRTWKRYRGGMATDIWLFNLVDKSARKITDWEGTDTIPMWVPGGDGKVVYYLSDNGPDHRLNIWSFDVASAKREQVTTFKDDDVRWPSVGPGAGGKGEIVFQLGSKLMLLDLGTRQSAEVKISIPGDRPKLRTRTVDADKNLSGGTISPSGKRVAVEARGEIFSAPVKEGVIRNLTNTNGVAERDPSWSPDGKWIAYFSDATGEYELYVRPSDAKPAEEKKDAKKDAKKDDKVEDKKAEDKKPEDKKPEGEEANKADEPAKDEGAAAPKVEPRKLTDLGPGFRFNPLWSPDSKWIAFTDQNGRLMLTDVATGATREIDKDPYMNQVSVSWSHDSKWMAYARGDNAREMASIWIADAKTGEKHQITAGMFDARFPTFDRKGDWLFYRQSSAVNNPVYSDLDTTYAYTNSDVLVMLPLRSDVKSPWLARSDEETLKKEEPKKDDAKKDGKDGEKKDEAKKDEAKKDEAKKDEPKKDDEKKEPAAAADDGVSGTWKGTVKGSTPELAMGLPVTMVLKLGEEGKLSGSISSLMGNGPITGSYDKSTGEMSFSVSVGQMNVTLTGTLTGEKVEGTWSAGDQKGTWTASRSSKGDGDKATGDKSGKGDKAEDKAAKEVKIDFDGIEMRALQLPVQPGTFGTMGVNDGDKLVFVRSSARSGSDSGIKIFDYKAEEPKEESVAAGGGFQMTADGKKLLIGRGTTLVVVDAATGGGKSQNVQTQNLTMTVDPRVEWKQIFTDSWRIMRDYFYEPTMHGLDWPKVRDHYGAMLADAASREDVNWIISEMISELNVGHAYLQGPGEVEDQPTATVGMLGCDYVLEKTDAGSAFKITKIYQGGPWDVDARGPLSQPGVDVKVGDYLLAVNGAPLDTKSDPWAAFVSTVGQTISITVSSKPTMDAAAREVLVKPIGSETDLRYRSFIEAKRAYVAEKSGSKMGYIYVPNTGVDGQNDLYRQFFGQRDRQALIIDERWNGGGQIPTRFIELLNRKPTNYWAKRDGSDWAWPPDAHFGPKAMLINGLAGSGGDMFPWLFKQSGVGKVIGTRTWGGLVGISGNPRMIDGGSISVPTFGFYKLDGNWGIEGHGTEPDIEVIDDPSKMTDGGDPQLDAAIAHLEAELKANPYVPPKRPASPNRSGMGSRPQER